MSKDGFSKDFPKVIHIGKQLSQKAPLKVLKQLLITVKSASKTAFKTTHLMNTCARGDNVWGKRIIT